ncbi:MAG: VCBS repeat-containing protein [Proteobacteria bacterium]|nr:VCBS repeat-containing protein [Pseudomonadota bacterium]
MLAIVLQPPVYGPSCHGFQAAAGDLDRDGRDEFAIACTGEPDIVVTLSEAGTLDRVWTSPVAEGSQCVTWGDYDDDGDVDLAVAGYGSPARIYRNDNGVLNLGWTAAEPTQSKDCEFADIDGDSDVDLVVAGSGTDQIYVNEGGGFQKARSVFFGDETDDIAFADFDQDGDLDLLAAISGKPSPEILFRNESGSFLRHWETPAAMQASAVAWADYDRDGKLDFAIARPNDPEELWRQASPGVFERVAWNQPASHAREILWVDLDRDQWPDLVVGREAPLVVWRNANRTLTAEPPLPGDEVLIEALATGDANADGRPDLFVAARDGDQDTQPRVRLYLGGEPPMAPGVDQEDARDMIPDRNDAGWGDPIIEEPRGLLARIFGFLFKVLLLVAILFGGWKASEYIKTLDKKP